MPQILTLTVYGEHMDTAMTHLVGQWHVRKRPALTISKS